MVSRIAMYKIVYTKKNCIYSMIIKYKHKQLMEKKYTKMLIVILSGQ